MVLHVLIVEDNDLFLNVNKKLVAALSRKYEINSVTKSFTHVGNELIKYIEEKRIDMAFLDIELGPNDGIALARKIKKIHPFASIVFISAHGEYIRKANQVHPIGFIEKPVNEEALEQLYLLVHMANVGKKIMEQKNTQIISFKKDYIDYEIRETEILYILKREQKLLVVTKNGSMSVRGTIKDMEEKLSDIFVKISRDTIVNKNELIDINRGKIQMSNKVELDLPMYKYYAILKKLRS